MHRVVLLILALLLFPAPAAAQKKSPPTGVTFTTTDSVLQRIYQRAELLARANIVDYQGRQAMMEGGSYLHFWLETQPMAGAMYAKRNLAVARTNVEIFLDHQRGDGRFPGVVYRRPEGIVPNYAQFQGHYLANAALDLYYWLGRDTAYLRRVYRALEQFDAYLWRTRDTDGNGCLETWCLYDNGEDHAERFNGFPNAWALEVPPTPERAAALSPAMLKTITKSEAYDPTREMVVPIESMDIMSYSYSNRAVLALIAAELGNGRADYWRSQAEVVSEKLRQYLWDEEKAACYDRDKHNTVMPILLHNNLRCMYFGSFSQQMADAFVARHLMNRKEFWTHLPLPSVAANDPAFRNIPENNWSGPAQGLTFQRAIRALERYGHFAELTLLGDRFLATIAASGRFTQQFDPFTGEADVSRDQYGPSILTALELISRRSGIHLARGNIYWSALEDGHDFTYEQTWNGETYTLTGAGNTATALRNGRVLFSFTRGVRVMTNGQGVAREISGIAPRKQRIRLTDAGGTTTLRIQPNEVYSRQTNGRFRKVAKVAFTRPY